MLQALLSQDMYLAGAFVLLLSSLTVVGMLISDILLVLLDPESDMSDTSVSVSVNNSDHVAIASQWQLTWCGFSRNIALRWQVSL